MTPERIEEIKSTLLVIQEREKYTIPSFLSAVSDYQDNSAKWLVGLLAALEESRQRIGKLELYVKSLEFNREDTQKRANEYLRERDTELAEAQQTIARQQSTLHYYARPASYADDGVLSKLPILDDGGLLARLCLGIDDTDAALGNKEGSDKAWHRYRRQTSSLTGRWLS